MKFEHGWWLPDSESHMQRYLERDGAYQVRHRQAALSLVPKWEVAVDVGAHVGLWTKDMCKKFKVVHAFEPIAEHVSCLSRNCESFKNLVIHQAVLGNFEGTVDMLPSTGNTGMTHVKPSNDGEHDPIGTLDSFNLENVDYIKLDVEGYELFVLQGAVETIRRCKPIISLEQKDQGYYGQAQFAARDFLKGLGMKLGARVVDDFVMVW